MTEPLRFSWQPDLDNSPLIIGWSADASKLGAKVIDYLNRKLGGQSFCELEPVQFFPLGGVTVEGSLVQFPESKFYSLSGKNLVLFCGDPPAYEWHRFLNLILDTAQHCCQVKELYTIGGMVSLSAHTAPRGILGIFNSPEMKNDLSHYNITREWDYESPPGQRPTLNSFLLWEAKNRSVPGTSLWAAIPFYLVTVGDPRAEKRVLDFFNQRFTLGIDFSDLDEEIRRQNQMIAEVRNDSPDVDEAIRRLESNLSLSEEQTQRLITEIERALRGR